MSQENVEVVRRIFDGWSQGDFSVGRDLMTADFEWQQQAAAVEPGSRRGAAIATAFRNLFEVWESFRSSPTNTWTPATRSWCSPITGLQREGAA